MTDIARAGVSNEKQLTSIPSPENSGKTTNNFEYLIPNIV